MAAVLALSLAAAAGFTTGMLYLLYLMVRRDAEYREHVMEVGETLFGPRA